MIIVNACDKEYFDRTKALIGSVLKNTDCKMYVHLVNVDEAINHPRVYEFHETKDFENDEHRRDYMANLRVYLFWKLYGKYDNLMLWLDSDSIVRWNLIDLENDLKNYGTAAVDTPEMSCGGKVEYNEKLISTVAINYSDDARDFLVEWLRQMQVLTSHKDYEYSIMTVQLAYILAIKRENPAYKDLTYFYSDKFFREESPIHEAQGLRKHKEPKYLEQVEHYLGVYRCLTGQQTESPELGKSRN